MADIHILSRSPEQFADGLVQCAKERDPTHLTAIGAGCLHAGVQLLVEQCGIDATREALLKIADNILSFPANDEVAGGPGAA